MADPKARYRTLLGRFVCATPLEIERYAEESVNIVLPTVPATMVRTICEDVGELFRDGPSLVEIPAPCIVIGDLHGHILDLLRVIKKFGMPDKIPFVFLGDLVDRGEFSIETVLIVFLLKLVHPENVHVVRGNHEFDFLSRQCGFMAQLKNFYDEQDLFECFMVTFSFMPLGCLIDEGILCIHGGLGPGVFSLSQFRKMERPVDNFDDDFIGSVLWGDPHDATNTFTPSSRGTGYFFGAEATKEFLTANRLTTLVRAHECVMGGVRRMFDGACVTVFTASNYCGLMGNSAGILEVKGRNLMHTHEFPPLQYLKRGSAVFRSMASGSSRVRFGSRSIASPKVPPTNANLSSSCNKLPPLSQANQGPVNNEAGPGTGPRRLLAPPRAGLAPNARRFSIF